LFLGAGHKYSYLLTYLLKVELQTTKLYRLHIITGENSFIRKRLTVKSR